MRATLENSARVRHQLGQRGRGGRRGQRGKNNRVRVRWGQRLGREKLLSNADNHKPDAVIGGALDRNHTCHLHGYTMFVSSCILNTITITMLTASGHKGYLVVGVNTDTNNRPMAMPCLTIRTCMMKWLELIEQLQDCCNPPPGAIGKSPPA